MNVGKTLGSAPGTVLFENIGAGCKGTSLEETEVGWRLDFFFFF